MTTFDDLVSAQLMRYFVVERGYLPVVVKSHKNEVFLERVDDPKIQLIRITPEPIVFGGQVDSDEERINEVVAMVRSARKVKKVNVLNIYTSPSFVKSQTKKHKNIISTSTKNEIGYADVIEKYFPNMHEHLRFTTDMDKEFKTIMHEISEHTKETHTRMTKLISTKWPIATYVILGLIVGFLLFGISVAEAVPGINLDQSVIAQGAANFSLVFGASHYWRLLAAGFITLDPIQVVFVIIVMFQLSKMVESSFGWLRTLIIVAFAVFTGNLANIVYDQSTIVIGQHTMVSGMIGALLYFGSQNKIIYSRFISKRMLLPILYLGFNIFSFGMGDAIAILFALVSGYFVAMVTSWKGTLPNKFAILGVFASLGIVIGLFSVVYFNKPNYMNYEKFDKNWIEYTNYLGQGSSDVGKSICEYYDVKGDVCKWK